MSELGQIKSQIVDACKRLERRQLVANHDGNISFKLADGRFLTTPTSFAKADVTESDLLILDSQGNVLEGKHKVFGEIAWHFAIYRVRPDVTCVVHAHPVTASGYGLAGRQIGTPAVPEAIVSLGRQILTTAFLSPLDPSREQSGGMFDLEFSRALAESDGCVVPGNGVFTVGQNVLQTYLRLELVEHIAQQHKIAEQLGTLKPLPAALVEELLKKRPASKFNAPEIPTKISALNMNPLQNPLIANSSSTNPSYENIKDLVRSELQNILK
ncbi:MAG: class II aldolase/adducin family protein [Oligoflexia bacterium]|nr:class II aldolase/adducin family protein [Oligoflexia bacterium]